MHQTIRAPISIAALIAAAGASAAMLLSVVVLSKIEAVPAAPVMVEALPIDRIEVIAGQQLAVQPVEQIEVVGRRFERQAAAPMIPGLPARKREGVL
jgi:hypothetical protein